jgi:PhoH-like ATPase
LIEVFMPLPKMPTKPAALLSPKDYPKAESGKPSKAVKVAHTEKTRAAENQAATAKKAQTPVATQKAGPRSTQKTAPAKATRIPAPAPAAAKIATPATTAVTEAKIPDIRVKSSISRAADKSGIIKLFVLDTNVLMHDPTSLFRFEEHDIYLPMITLEELDDHKKGMSEVARNARQISRSLDALVGDIDHQDIEKGIPLSKLGNKEAKGHLYFQTKLQVGELPRGLPQGKADNQILGVVQALEQEFPGALSYWCQKTSTCVLRRVRWVCQRKITSMTMFWKTAIYCTPASYSCLTISGINMAKV